MMLHKLKLAVLLALPIGATLHGDKSMASEPREEVYIQSLEKRLEVLSEVPVSSCFWLKKRQENVKIWKQEKAYYTFQAKKAALELYTELGVDEQENFYRLSQWNKAYYEDFIGN